MATLGNTANTAEHFGKAIRSGVITLAVSDLTKSVSFASAMPSANYRLFLQVEGNLVAVLWPTSKTTTGFVINVSVGISGTIAYLAIED